MVYKERECGYPNWQAKQNKMRVHRRRKSVSDYGIVPVYAEWRAYCPCCCKMYCAIDFNAIKTYVVNHIRTEHTREWSLAVFQKREMISPARQMEIAASLLYDPRP